MTDSIDRRRMLMGLGAAGAAGGALLAGGGMALPAGAAEIDRSSNAAGGASTADALAATLVPSVPGVIYSSVSGYELQPVNATPTMNDIGGIGVGPSTTAFCVLGVPVPDGGLIKELHLFGSGSLSMGLQRNLVGTYAWSQVTTASTPAGAGLQHAAVTGLNLVNDTASFSLLLGGSIAAGGGVQSVAIGFIPAATGFVPVTPTRVYDSRWNPAPGGVTVGTLTAPNSRVISAANGRDLTTGAITTANLVPVEAKAVSYNLTAVAGNDTGFLAIAPGNAGTYAASAINWSKTGAIANGGVAKLGTARDLKIFAGGPGAVTDFIVDITGYYV